MTMRKWVLAGGIALSGLAFAGQQDDTSVQQSESQAHQKEQQTKKKVEQKSEKAARGAEAGGYAVSQSLSEAGRSLEGQPSRLPMGMTRRGDVRNTITTDALGLFGGRGLNAAYSRSVSPKWSFVGGVDYGRTTTPLGAATSFALRAGADYFIIGEHNEGLRIGPRVDFSFGANSVTNVNGFANVGAAGELGYNWISTRGLTAGAGVGMRAATGRSDIGPYIDLNLGYSW